MIEYKSVTLRWNAITLDSDIGEVLNKYSNEGWTFLNSTNTSSENTYRSHENQLTLFFKREYIYVYKETNEISIFSVGNTVKVVDESSNNFNRIGRIIAIDTKADRQIEVLLSADLYSKYYTPEDLELVSDN